MTSAAAPRSPADPAVGEVLERLVQITGWIHGQIASVAARHGLTPQQAKLLRSLGEPRPMGALAGDLGCDPSNVTGLIDRIERRGLVERSADPADRRVKLLSLTRAGREVRDQAESGLVEEAAALNRLDGGEIRHLLVLLERFVPADVTKGQTGPACT